MNNWEEIIKAARDRKGKVGRGKEIPESVRPGKVRRPKQTRMKGGNPIEDLKEKDSPEKDLFEYDEKTEEDFYSRMAEEEFEEMKDMKRSEMMDEIMDRISSFSTSELLRLLVKARKGLLED